MQKTSLVSFILFATFSSVCARADTFTQFQAVLGGPHVVKDGAIASTATATGLATFTLTQPTSNPGGTTLSYHIALDNLDLDGRQTPGIVADDATAIHFHDVTKLPNGSAAPVGDTGGTLHVLNVFGVPRGGDESEMMFDAPAGIVTGRWDDGDATPGLSMAPSLKISENVTPLFAEQLFVMVHSTEFPNGAIGGHIRVVPEPSSLALVIAAGSILLLRLMRMPANLVT